jgi:hypothetical protein
MHEVFTLFLRIFYLFSMLEQLLYWWKEMLSQISMFLHCITSSRDLLLGRLAQTHCIFTSSQPSTAT